LTPPVLLFLAFGPYFVFALAGFAIAWRLTRGNVDTWMILYLAIPIVVLGVGYGTDFVRTLVGGVVTPTLTSFGAVPLAILGGAEGTRQRWGPVPRSLVLAGEIVIPGLVMVMTRNLGEC
jgi:hypothetical protein